MSRQIPGFYFDAANKRYYRIQVSEPATTPWAATNVTKRKREEACADQEKKVARAARRRTAAGAPTRVKRCAGLLQDPLIGGSLCRETGGGVHDMAAQSWALGVRDMGAIKLWPGASGITQNVPLFWVSGQEMRSSLGVAIGSLDGRTLWSRHVPRDEVNRIDYSQAAERYPGVNFNPRCEDALWMPSEISSIKFHQPSGHLLATSRDSEDVHLLSWPAMPSDEVHHPHWLPGHDLANAGGRRRLKIALRDTINACAPAPASSPLLCLLATNKGVVSIDSGTQAARASTPGAHLPPGARGAGRDMTALDFTGPQCFYLGGRDGRVWLADDRQPAHEWKSITHGRAVSHVRSLKAHEVLVAGPGHSDACMCVYDVRFATKGQANDRRQHRHVLGFPEYHNGAHVFQIGLDVSSGELGVAAAAQDNGTLALFSLRSGRRLRSPILDATRTRNGGPVKSLMFQQMPGDAQPGLYVGLGAVVQKYAFGVGAGEHVLDLEV